MLSKLKRIPKEKYYDYFILVARFLIGWTFIRYGYSKLIDGQFGITTTELATPLQDLNMFRVSWYLFDQEPFKSFIGFSQIFCGILLIINRTAILGAFLFLPIVATILIIDITFMPSYLANSFAWRLSFYILLDFLILWHYKDKMKIIWNAVMYQVNTKFKFKIWHYLLLPLMAIILEIIGVLPKILVQFLSNPRLFIESITDLFSKIFDTIF